MAKLEFWAGADMIFQCLIDKKRVESFRRAIKSVIKKNSCVVDIGTGTGILAMFAAQAGARKVYAIEADKNLYKTLEMNLAYNKYKEKIILIKKEASKVKLPEKVDVVICEMVATGLIDEFQVPAMNYIQKFCKKNTKIIPSSIENFVELAYAKDDFYGHKMEVVQYEYEWAKGIKSTPLTGKKMYKKVDFTQKNPLWIEVNLKLKATKTGKINAIRITNQTTFSDKSTFESSLAYCMPLLIPIKPLNVKKNQKINLWMKYKMCGGLETFDYNVY